MGAVVAAALSVPVTQAPAGNRGPVVDLQVFPGPSEVTYGQNVAYTSTLFNNQKSNFTHVFFHNPIPFTLVNGTPVQAKLKYASCSGTTTATEFVCDELSQLPPGQTAKVTIVWQTPAAGSSPDCLATTPVCMTNAIKWTIKEGTGNPGSSGPDTFTSNPVFTSLIVVPDPKKAGGYALNACGDPTSPTLGTNGDVSTSNPLATSVCASTLPQGDAFNPGLVVSIAERDHAAGDPGFTQVANICIPQPGDSCDGASYTPWVFSPPATITLVFDTTGLGKITKIFHDGVEVACDLTKKGQITTAVCPTATNGQWSGG